MTNKEYLDLIESALKKIALNINDKLIPSFSGTFSSFSTSFEMFYDVAIKKSFISQDPYDGDRIKELEVPKNIKVDPANLPSDSDLTDFYSVEFSSYRELLSYINNHYIMSTESFSLKDLSMLKEIVLFIDWQRLYSSENNDYSTRFTNTIYRKFTHSNEKFVVQIAIDVLTQCKKNQKELINLLEFFYIWKTQVLVFELRDFINENKIEIGNDSKENIFKILKKELAKKDIKFPKLKMITEELYNQDYDENSELYRKKMIDFLLKNTNECDDTKVYLQSLRAVLFDALDHFGESYQIIKIALRNVVYNSSLLASKNRVLRKYPEKFKKIRSDSKETMVYMFSSRNNMLNNSINIDISKFESNLLKKIEIFEEISLKSKEFNKKIAAMSNDDIYRMSNTLDSSLAIMINRFNFFNNLFSELKPEEKDFDMFIDLSLEIKQLQKKSILINQDLSKYLVKSKNVIV